MKGIMFTHTLN